MVEREVSCVGGGSDIANVHGIDMASCDRVSQEMLKCCEVGRFCEGLRNQRVDIMNVCSHMQTLSPGSRPCGKMDKGTKNATRQCIFVILILRRRT